MTFTPSGTMRAGVCYALGTLAPGTNARGSGSSGAVARELLPTVCADGDRATDYAQGGRSLGAEVRRRTLPTVVAQDGRGANDGMADYVRGQTLSANFCEWHMGAPCGWGDLTPLPKGALEAWEEAARNGTLWWAPPPMTALKGQEPRRAARIRQAGNAWVPACAWVAFDLLGDDF